MKLRSSLSNSLIPNPPLPASLVASVTAKVVLVGLLVEWVSDTTPGSWRLWRIDASTNSAPVLVAVLPGAARSFTDFTHAETNPYQQGHAHTYRVQPLR